MITELVEEVAFLTGYVLLRENREKLQLCIMFYCLSFCSCIRRYQVAAPYAEEAAPREYNVLTPGPEDVKVRVQCPPSPRAKVTVNVNMDSLLD